MTAQPTLFDLPAPPRRDCVRNGPCKTCGATRPADFGQHMFLEPVSHECHACNYSTLDAILDAARRRDRVAYDVAWNRHYPGKPRARRAANRQ